MTCLMTGGEKTDRYRTMAKVRIKLTRNIIGSTVRQKRTVEALGLKKMNSSVEVEATPQIKGMIRKVDHLVTVEEVK